MFRNTLMASALVLIAGVASADTVFTVANTFEDPANDRWCRDFNHRL